VFQRVRSPESRHALVEIVVARRRPSLRVHVQPVIVRIDRQPRPFRFGEPFENALQNTTGTNAVISRNSFIRFTNARRSRLARRPERSVVNVTCVGHVVPLHRTPREISAVHVSPTARVVRVLKLVGSDVRVFHAYFTTVIRYFGAGKRQFQRGKHLHQFGAVFRRYSIGVVTFHLKFERRTNIDIFQTICPNVWFRNV